MLEDSAQFQELQNKKDEDAKEMQARIENMVASHNQLMNQMEAEHRMNMEAQIAQKEQLKKEIEGMERQHKEIQD